MNNFKVTFSEEKVKDFCKLTGDENEIHADGDVARSIGMKGSIVNGALTLSKGIGLLVQELNTDSRKILILESNSKYKKEVLVGKEYIYKLKKIDDYLNDTIQLYEITVSTAENKEYMSKPCHIHKVLTKSAIVIKLKSDIKK